MLTSWGAIAPFLSLLKMAAQDNTGACKRPFPVVARAPIAAVV